MQTIIDILRKGNQELFHSAMIAWLLDPEGEHNLGRRFLDAFAHLLSGRGLPSLQEALKRGPADVRTEVGVPGGRYDIALEIGNLKYVIENKTKSVGNVLHLARYERPGVTLIPVGMCRASFADEIYRKYVVVHYSDILDILKSIPLLETNDFHLLLKHYKLFLERELTMLDLILECFKNGIVGRHTEILERFAQVPGRTRNDERFLNLYYIEHLKHHLEGNPLLARASWASNKNEISGVWLANYGGLPSAYSFHSVITEICTHNEAQLWFHIELWKGVLAASLNDVAGMIQLRCSAARGSSLFLVDLKPVIPLHGGQYLPTRLKRGAGSFYVVGQNLTKQELVFSTLLGRLLNFMQQFGTFRGPA